MLRNQKETSVEFDFIFLNSLLFGRDAICFNYACRKSVCWANQFRM